jgi:hypothetical protein
MYYHLLRTAIKMEVAGELAVDPQHKQRIKLYQGKAAIRCLITWSSNNEKWRTMAFASSTVKFLFLI